MLYETAVFMATPHDWPEDYAQENGFYWNTCVECRHLFTGHKRRVVCKQCTRPTTPTRGSDE